MNIQQAFDRLITCPEPLRWHPEGFTGIHSAIVAARAILSGATGGKNGRSLLMAALLHDIGKPTSGWMVDGAWINHSHPQDGYDIIMNNDDIRYAVASVADLDHVAGLTCLHMGLKAHALGDAGFPNKDGVETKFQSVFATSCFVGINVANGARCQRCVGFDTYKHLFGE